MYEIELKAHVFERQKTISLINTFAQYQGTTIKDDTYYKFFQDKNSVPVNCRIRHEQYTFPDNSTKTQDLLTYKSKEKRFDQNGATYEVNEENESVLSNSEALKKLLISTGYNIAYTKHKDVMQWNCKTPYGTAHLELCTVPPLGDFLEIEVVTDSTCSAQNIQEELKKLILKSGIPLSNIEEKYYSELLQLAKYQNKK